MYRQLIAVCLSALLTVGPAFAGEVYSSPRPVYVAQNIYVPVVVPGTLLVNLSPPTSPPLATVSLAAFQAEQARATQGTDRLQALERKIDLLTTALANQQTQRPSPSSQPAEDLPPPVRGVTPSQPSYPAASAIPSPQRPEIGQVAGILKQSCAQCHTGSRSRGDVVLFDETGYFAPKVSAREIYAAVRDDFMPKGPVKLSSDQKFILETWALRPPG